MTASKGNATLKGQVYDALFSDIINGTYPPDYVFTEKFLMEKYQVSRAPIREALISLVTQQVLESVPRQGYRISYAIITAENEASFRFHEAMGYRTVAELPNCGYKMGRWLGIRYLQKDLNPLGAPEAFPVSWRELEGQA